MNEINAKIDIQVCYDTIAKLKDENLIDEYKQCNSVILETKKLSVILRNNKVDEETIEKIVNDYFLNIIPPGTKGVIRGNKFNKIVESHIKTIDLLSTDDYEVKFEKVCESCITTEIPDFYILQKSSGKVIIGMCQLDLWTGGQQINRGSKYLKDNKHNTEKSKLLCVICNYIVFKSIKNKAFALFDEGFANDTLCYLNGLSNIINNYFIHS